MPDAPNNVAANAWLRAMIEHMRGIQQRFESTPTTNGLHPELMPFSGGPFDAGPVFSSPFLQQLGGQHPDLLNEFHHQGMMNNWQAAHGPGIVLPYKAAPSSISQRLVESRALAPMDPVGHTAYNAGEAIRHFADLVKRPKPKPTNGTNRRRAI